MKFRYVLPTLYLGISFILFLLAEVGHVKYLQECDGDFFAVCVPRWVGVPLYMSFPGLILPVIIFLALSISGFSEEIVFDVVALGGSVLCSVVFYYLLGRIIDKIVEMTKKKGVQAKLQTSSRKR